MLALLTFLAAVAAASSIPLHGNVDTTKPFKRGECDASQAVDCIKEARKAGGSLVTLLLCAAKESLNVSTS